MKFRLGAIPGDFSPDEAWRPIREPSPLWLQVMAVPIGIGAFIAVVACWLWIEAPASVSFSTAESHWLTLGMALSFPVLVVVHELLHAVVHPGWGTSPATVIGAWPSRLLFYAHYCGPLSRDRFLAVFAMPLLVITGLPLLLAALDWLPAWSTPVLAWFSIWNALFACGDMVGFLLILAQIPRRAIVQNQGWRTYWKPR